MRQEYALRGVGMCNSGMGYLLVIGLSLLLSACGGGGVGGSSSATASTSSSSAGWERQAGNPLIVPTLTSTTQDFGPADPTVLFDSDDNKWKTWFSSTLKDRASGVETMVIRYAESTNGVSWSAPVTAMQVATSATAWDHTNVETPTVIKNPNPAAPAGQKFMLWYAGANKLLAATEGRPSGFPYYRIGLAWSADGKSFTRHTPGLDGKPGLVLSASLGLFGAGLPGIYGDGLVADPDVIYRNGVYHMWLSSFAETVPGRSPLAFGIAHVTSSDGISWSAPHANPLASLAKPGEAGAGQQPSVLFNPAASRYEMWFSNDTPAEKASIPCSFNTVRGFWRAVSNDGVSWTPDYSKRSLSYETNYGYESLGFLTGVKVVLDGAIYRAWYVGWGTGQIPDSSLYLCPNQSGTYVPGVLTLSRASTLTP